METASAVEKKDDDGGGGRPSAKEMKVLSPPVFTTRHRSFPSKHHSNIIDRLAMFQRILMVGEAGFSPRV